jgi:hypothetical protein
MEFLGWMFLSAFLLSIIGYHQGCKFKILKNAFKMSKIAIKNSPKRFLK